MIRARTSLPHAALALAAGFWIAVCGAAPAPATAAPLPRIVNGTATAGYPSTGLLLIYTDATRTAIGAFCSGVLIGCHTFLTAAHCLCPVGADTAATCLSSGLVPPSALQVLLTNGGFFDVEGDAIDPQFNFAAGGDLGIVSLSRDANGIGPSPINRLLKPPLATPGTIVGFGVTRVGRNSPNDAGIKRQGPMVTGDCSDGLSNDGQLCWSFVGTGANTCDGDSGGPMFVDVGAGTTVAGITSGGNSATCLAPDEGFDTDVFSYASWIADQSGADLGAAGCGDLGTVGSTSVSVTPFSGALSAAVPEQQLAFSVAENTRVLRVALNSQVWSSSSNDNDFDLLLRAGAPPTNTSFDCADRSPLPLAYCEISAPAAGTWYALVSRYRGDGAFQLTATAFAEPVPCISDCDGSGRVTAADIVAGLAVGAGRLPASACPGSAGIHSLADLLDGIDNVFNGCP